MCRQRGLPRRTGRAGCVKEAERLFYELRARGATAFKVDAGQAAERMDVFDPHAEQIVVIPRVAGG